MLSKVKLKFLIFYTPILMVNLHLRMLLKHKLLVIFLIDQVIFNYENYILSQKMIFIYTYQMDMTERLDWKVMAFLAFESLRIACFFLKFPCIFSTVLKSTYLFRSISLFISSFCFLLSFLLSFLVPSLLTSSTIDLIWKELLFIFLTSFIFIDFVSFSFF